MKDYDNLVNSLNPDSEEDDDELLGKNDKPLTLRRYTDNPKLNINPNKVTHRYHHVRELGYVKAFMVNVHDATNYDIDLILPSHLLTRYRTVLSNNYLYKEFNDLTINPETIDNLPNRIGITYRCRLRGVGLNANLDRRINFQLATEIKQLTDRTDGWINCVLTDIDIYRRLLIDIYITVDQKIIDLKEFLLAKEDEKGIALFHPYNIRV